MSNNFELPDGACWTQKHVIDPRIDTHAQRALIEMFANRAEQSATASAIMFAVKQDRLGGIYLPDQQVPALRAKDSGGWWTILKGRDAICYREPPAESPLIVFSKKIVADRQRLIEALVSAWKACNLSAPPERCYEGQGVGGTPPKDTDFRATLTVSVVKKPSNECAAKADVHLMSGSQQVGGERTSDSGVAQFEIGWPDLYTIYVAQTPDCGGKQVDVKITKAGHIRKDVELSCRHGVTPAQGVHVLCGWGEAEQLGLPLNKHTALALARTFANQEANRNLDREVAKFRETVRRTHGASAKITESPRFMPVSNESEGFASMESLPDSNVEVPLMSYKVTIQVCTTLSWVASP